MATPHNSISYTVLIPGASVVALVIGGNLDMVPLPPPVPPANTSASGTPTTLVPTPITTPGGGSELVTSVVSSNTAGK